MSDASSDLGSGFDQTNGVVAGLGGESDGSAEGDLDSAGDRAGDDRDVLDDALVEDDRSGAADVDDPAS